MRPVKGVFREVNYEHPRPVYLSRAEKEDQLSSDGTAQPPSLKTTLTASSSFDLPSSLDHDQGPLIFQPSQSHCCRSLPGLIIFSLLGHFVRWLSFRSSR